MSYLTSRHQLAHAASGKSMTDMFGARLKPSKRAARHEPLALPASTSRLSRKNISTLWGNGTGNGSGRHSLVSN